MRHRESISGGAGADAADGSSGDDDEFKPAIHVRHFFGGKVPTMVHEDIMKAKCGGGTMGSGLADAGAADGFAGSGTSVPRGSGLGRSPSRHRRRHRRVDVRMQGKPPALGGRGVGTRQRTTIRVLLGQAERHSCPRCKRSPIRWKPAEGGLKYLADIVLRLENRVHNLPDNVDADSREEFEELLQEAKY